MRAIANEPQERKIEITRRARVAIVAHSRPQWDSRSSLFAAAAAPRSLCARIVHRLYKENRARVRLPAWLDTRLPNGTAAAAAPRSCCAARYNDACSDDGPTGSGVFRGKTQTDTRADGSERPLTIRGTDWISL
ncbi:hypothetical protein HN011_005139 [Eciton burchellii]|nr:hypothetical protein HN011_005139 [Eciton burchellii]